MEHIGKISRGMDMATYHIDTQIHCGELAENLDDIESRGKENVVPRLYQMGTQAWRIHWNTTKKAVHKKK